MEPWRRDLERRHDLAQLMSLHPTEARRRTGETSPRPKPEEFSIEDWSVRVQACKVERCQLNKVIMDYLITEGFKEVAEEFAAETGVVPALDAREMEERVQIRRAVEEGRCEEAISLLNQIAPQILEKKKYLLFHLQQQLVIELIREGKVEEALCFAQRYLTERVSEEAKILVELERTLALLAFDDPLTCPFSDLLDMKHRENLAAEVNAALLEYLGERPTTYLADLLHLVTWREDQVPARLISLPRISNLATGQFSRAGRERV